MFSSKIAWATIALFILVMRKEAASANTNSNVISFDGKPEDARLNFTQLAIKYGGACQEHNVITDDGYILKVFRVPRAGSRAVLINHGSLGSADDFIIRGPTSLVIGLYEAGYDVWVMNTRGNHYSRRHITLDPDTDKKFWDFSIQEVVTYDMPAIVDYVLAYSGQEQLAAIGFSVGTLIFYGFGAERPEYNAKISLMISLAPICYMYNSVPLSNLHAYWRFGDQFFSSLGVDEVNAATMGHSSTQAVCLEVFSFLGPTMAQAVCLEMSMAVTPGYDTTEIEPEFTPIIMAHFPSSSSRKLCIHFGQIGQSRRLAQYDYGLVENIARYGSAYPPEYDLSLVEMPIVLISGKADIVSTLKDVQVLKPQLPNLVEHIILEPENFNHIDFMWGKHTHETLHPYIYDLLQIYT